jgi:hypothetical protein
LEAREAILRARGGDRYGGGNRPTFRAILGLSAPHYASVIEQCSRCCCPTLPNCIRVTSTDTQVVELLGIPKFEKPGMRSDARVLLLSK